MKKIDSIPVISNVHCNYEFAYDNISEKERFRKSTSNLLRLKELIINNPELCNAFLKEYIWKHGIYDDEYYRISKLINLNNYLNNSDFKIDPKKSMKEILIDGLNYIEDNNSNEDKLIRKDSKAVTQQAFHHLKKFKKKVIKVNDKDEAPAFTNIVTDMHLQNKLYKSKAYKTNLDIINQPDKIVNLLEDEFIEKQFINNNEFIKNVPIPSPRLGLKMKKKKNDGNKLKTSNERLLYKKKEKSDYDIVKQNNKLLEYVCYVKAKNNLQYLNLKRNSNIN